MNEGVRTITWGTSFIGCLLGALTGCQTSESEKAEPNFVVFLTDDLGYGDLSCYGHPIVKTPNLDRFASEGVRLTDCHSAGTVCSPSRAGILTGRNPYRTGFYYIAGAYGAYLHSEEVTIAELLHHEGYQTAFFGKWHLSRLEKPDQPNPGDQGFDYWLATSVNAFEGPRNPLHFIRNGEKTGMIEGWYCDIVVRESLKWLKTISRENPFFLMICTHEPHTPLAPPDSLSAPYYQDSLIPFIKNIKYGGVERAVPDTLLGASKYYGTLNQLDHAFGVFIDGLDQMGFKSNTLVFLTSDNGPEHPVNFEESKGEWDDPIRDYCFGTPGPYRGMKRYPYEGGHRVPGIIRWPGNVPAGSTSDQLFSGADVLPAFCYLAGVDIPENLILDGEQAYSAILGKPVKRKHPVIWIFPTHADTYFRMPHIAMRYKHYDLVGWFPPKPDTQKLLPWMKSSVAERFALYDLKRDTGQIIDLSGKRPGLLRKLSKTMNRLWIDIRPH